MNGMLQLLGHILRISSRRDRTEINEQLLEAMQELFNPLDVRLLRCYANEERVLVHDVAGLSAEGSYYRNAYLPDQRHCSPINDDPLLTEAWRTLTLQSEPFGTDWQRLVFPVAQDKKLHYLLDCVLARDFDSDQSVLLMGLTEFFAKHIALLDYGETDTLTELANRKTFDKHLFEVLGQAALDALAMDKDNLLHRRRGSPLGVCHWLAVCDIDKFKSINDTHGHLIGDEVLVMMAQLMRRSFRLADQLFRFGGEEFVIVLQPTNPADALGVFERFRSQVAAHNFSRVGHVTISIGFTQLQAADSPSQVIDRADEALYFAKSNGRNQVAFYEDLVADGRLVPKTVDHGDIELF